MHSMQANATAGSVIARRWFCCLLNVQAGVIIFSSMGCALMITVSLLNLGAEENPEALPNRATYYSVLYFYTLPMLIGFSLLYVGANQLDVNILTIGLAIQCAFFVYWITITTMSFVDEPKYVYSVCIDNRCPETLWLYNTEWRTYGNECVVYVDELLVAPPEDLKESHQRQFTRNESAESPVENIDDTGYEFVRKIPKKIAKTDLNEVKVNLGVRGLNSLHNDSNGIRDSRQINHTTLFSRNYNSTTHNNSSVERHNHANEDDGDSWGVEQLIENSTLVTGRNQSSGTTRFARLSESKKDMEDVLQALLQLMSKKPFVNLQEAEKLRAVLYGSRVLGCTEDIERSRAKSIAGAVIWFVFVVYGNLGAFILIIELRRMAATGELQDGFET